MLTNKLWQQLFCLILIGAGCLVGNLEPAELRDQYLAVTFGLWLQLAGAICYTRLIPRMLRYAMPVRVLLTSGFLAVQMSTVSRFAEFDPDLSSLGMLVGSGCTIALLVMSLWRSSSHKSNTNSKPDTSILNDQGKLPILLQVTITGASSIEDDDARRKTIERVVKPLLDQSYETTDLTGDTNGELWVLLMRKA